MKFKCAIFKSVDFKMPTFSEIDASQPKNAKVIYGGGKRRTKKIPFLNELHLVTGPFYELRNHIAPNIDFHMESTELFIFQDEVNELFLKIRYTNEIVAMFELDSKIIDEMHHYSWSLNRIEELIRSIKYDNKTSDFFIEKNIGDKFLHKSFDSYVKNNNKTIADLEKSKQKIIKNAVALFNSGW